uniref:Metalloendopeptidase n=1 Tax=Eptatretus burgeri TaxID=7764 RepID=A0A8C4QL07_EPTBU
MKSGTITARPTWEDAEHGGKLKTKESNLKRTEKVEEDPWNKYPGKNVFNFIITNDDEREIIQQAVQEFRAKTCVRLVQRTSEADFIFIQALGKTWSFLGRLGGAQSLSLSESGVVHKAKVLHMLMHVLGFHHEHCRSDRDKYIRVMKDNIQNGEVFDPPCRDVFIRTTFAKDENKPVIIPLTPMTIGHADCLSDLDIDRIRRLYAGE